MGVRILYGKDGNSCIYDSVTETVFGLLFWRDEDPQDFLNWLGVDARTFSNKDIAAKINEWRRLRQTETAR